MARINLGHVKGPQGPQGPKGNDGAAGAQGPKGDTGAQGPKGTDGFSPTVSVTDISGGHKVTITDAEGEHEFEVMDGEDGRGQSINDKIAENTSTFTYTELCDDDEEITISNNSNDANVVVVGRNLIPNNIVTQEAKGITITRDSDGTITLNGTLTSALTLYFYNDTNNPRLLPKGDYMFRTEYEGVFTNSANVRIRYGNTDVIPQYAYSNNKYKTFTLDEDKQFNNVLFYYSSGSTFENHKIKFAIFYGGYMTDYEPYYEKVYTVGETVKSKRDGLVYLSDFSSFKASYVRNDEVWNEYRKTYKKKVMFFGDSITAWWRTYGSELIFKSRMTVVNNFAVASATFCNSASTVMDGNPTTSSNNTLPNQVQKLLNGTYDTPDIVIISGGTNDATPNNTDVESQFTTPEGTTVR